VVSPHEQVVRLCKFVRIMRIKSNKNKFHFDHGWDEDQQRNKNKPNRTNTTSDRIANHRRQQKSSISTQKQTPTILFFSTLQIAPALFFHFRRRSQDNPILLCEAEVINGQVGHNDTHLDRHNFAVTEMETLSRGEQIRTKYNQQIAVRDGPEARDRVPASAGRESGLATTGYASPSTRSAHLLLPESTSSK